MYFDHFGLSQAPFKITPDTSLFFPGGNRGAVLEALSYAIASGEGIVKVVGEVGSGKTMLCRMLELELPDNCDIVYLANPSLTRDDILHAIAFELKLPVDTGHNRLQVMQVLQQHLLSKHANDRRVVVFVEEAQGMPLETLEEIRLLSNLETNQDKLLQIVLFGQPELDEMLTAHGIRQLRERITYSFDLEPFRGEQVRDYVNSRLRSSGHRAGELFTGGAVRELTRYSRGLLRRINILADKALLAAYADNARQVKAGHVRRAAKDSDFAALPRSRAPWLAAASVVLLLGGAVAWALLGRETPPQRPLRIAATPPAATAEPAAEAAPAAPSTEESRPPVTPPVAGITRLEDLAPIVSPRPAAPTETELARLLQRTIE